MSLTNVILNGGEAAVRDRTSAESSDVVYGNYGTTPARSDYLRHPPLTH